VVTVVVIAAINVAARRDEERRQRSADDRVAVDVSATTGVVRAKTFSIVVVIDNAGGQVTLGKPRLAPSTLELDRVEPSTVPAKSTVTVNVWVRAICPQLEDPGSSVDLLLDVTPASGRVRQVRTDVYPEMLRVQNNAACGFLTAPDATSVRASSVVSTRYAVTFRLTIENRSIRTFILENLTSTGLAPAVRDGLPAQVPSGPTELFVSMSLPACSRLPVAPSFGRGGPRFGTLVLEFLDNEAVRESTQFVPSGELMQALLQLRSRICPGAGTHT
jgi:hypothetical protein